MGQFWRPFYLQVRLFSRRNWDEQRDLAPDWDQEWLLEPPIGHFVRLKAYHLSFRRLRWQLSRLYEAPKHIVLNYERVSST